MPNLFDKRLVSPIILIDRESYKELILTANPLSFRAWTVTCRATPASGEMLTLNGESGMCSSLNLIWTPYMPVSKILSLIVDLVFVLIFFQVAITSVSGSFTNDTYI